MGLGGCWKAVTVAMATATLLGACGDDESSAPSTTAAAPTTSTTLSQVDLDKQKAGRIVLTAADVPGFSMDPPDPAPQDGEFETAVNACLNNDPVLVRLGDEKDPRGASGADFSKGEELKVSSSATFGETEDQARSAFTALNAASFPACFSRALTTELRRTTALSDVTLNTTKLPALTTGDQSVGFRSVARARASGRAVVINLDFTFLRVGRAVAVLEGSGVGPAFPEAERSRLAAALAGRMAGP